MKNFVKALCTGTAMVVLAGCSKDEPKPAPVLNPVHQEFARITVPVVEQALTEINAPLPETGHACAEFTARTSRARAMLMMSEAYRTLKTEEVAPYSDGGPLVPWKGSELNDMTRRLTEARDKCFGPMRALSQGEIETIAKANLVEPTRSMIFTAADAFSDALEAHKAGGNKISRVGCLELRAYRLGLEDSLNYSIASPKYADFERSAQRFSKAVGSACE